MTVDWSLCRYPACIEECRDAPKIDCPAVLAWREKKDDTMTDDNGPVSTIPASAETISMTDHLRLMSAQAARIAELEAAIKPLMDQVGSLLNKVDDLLAPEDGGLSMHAYGQSPDWFVEAALYACYGTTDTNNPLIAKDTSHDG